MFIRTKCATPFGTKSIKLYCSETRQITKGRKSGKYVYASRSNGGLEYFSSLGKGTRLFYFVSVIINYDFDLRASYFQKAGSKCIRKVKSIKTQSHGKH